MLEVWISRYVDDHFPGWVECALVDAFAQEHLFREKVPVVTSNSITPESTFPQPGGIACTVEAKWSDETGRGLIRLTTESPWGVESIKGVTQFVVLQSQVVSDDS